MEALAHCVGRRDTLVNRAMATSAHRASQRPQTTRILIHKKIDDLRNRLKKMARQEKELTAIISEAEGRENELENELEAKQETLRQLHEQVGEFNNQIEKYFSKKESRMAEIMLLQTRSVFILSPRKAVHQLFAAGVVSHREELIQCIALKCFSNNFPLQPVEIVNCFVR
jgi:chromosome segregation ATPase